MIRTRELLDLSCCPVGEYLAGFEYPWQALGGIEALILALGPQLGEAYREIFPRVWVHKTALISSSAYLGAPAIIGAGTQVRHCAFIRGSALIGKNCVVGNSVEVKNAILFDEVQVPHFNYVGDSILGLGAHMGAGSVTSNVRADKGAVVVKTGRESIPTGLAKFGAILGDYAEIGCNAVLNPGTVVGRNAIIYPTSCVRGVVPENSIWKNDGTVIRKQ